MIKELDEVPGKALAMLLHTVLCNMLQTRVCGHPVPREEFDKARPLTSVINNCFRASYTNMAKSRAEADRQKARINIRSQKLTWKFVYLGFTDQRWVAGYWQSGVTTAWLLKSFSHYVDDAEGCDHICILYKYLHHMV